MLLCHLWENFRTSCFITHTDSEWTGKNVTLLPLLLFAFMSVGTAEFMQCVMSLSLIPVISLWPVTSDFIRRTASNTRMHLQVYAHSLWGHPLWDTVTCHLWEHTFPISFFPLLFFHAALQLAQSHLLRAPVIPFLLGICRQRTKARKKLRVMEWTQTGLRYLHRLCSSGSIISRSR